MKLQTKGEIFIRCEAHEGEVKLLWKGAAVETVLHCTLHPVLLQ